MTTQPMTDSPTRPVDISPEAHTAISARLRVWSGWPNAVLVFGTPTVSPHAQCDHRTREFVANPEILVLNPHRVLHTVTPFRLRQEAVLTGALLHEAAHARHSNWQPRSAEQFEAMTHGDDHTDDQGNPTRVTKQTLALAKLCEEARIEGIMAAQCDTMPEMGAVGLDWTMRASAAKLLPTTRLTVADPGQRLMDLLTSWVLRAGRQLALAKHTGHTPAPWVHDFTALLHEQLVKHFEPTVAEQGSAVGRANRVERWLTEMCCAWTEADTGTWMLDRAKDVRDLLFPETTGDENDAPMPGDPMHEPGADDNGETEEIDAPSQQTTASEEGEDGEDDDAEGESDDEPADSGADQGNGEGESQSEGEKAGESGAGTEDGTSEGGADSESEGDPSDDGSDGGIADLAKALAEMENTADLAKALAEMENTADTDTQGEGQSQAAAPPEQQTSGGGASTSGAGGEFGAGWRDPIPAERGVAAEAERMLRSLIDPSETSHVSLSESPCSTIDAPAYAAWKAGGGRAEPRFFRRTRREVKPSPPVKIAVLVDVSISMEKMQKPSALLSWALSNAALDLRNFAGRGVQVESTLIHWGSRASVVQPNGQPLPGLREFDCNQMTYAMGPALELVAEQILGFFDVTETPQNRLLVHFTDWMLGSSFTNAVPLTCAALHAGVNMLSVVPEGYSEYRSSLPQVLAKCTLDQRGRSHVVKYRGNPTTVWAEAGAMLGGSV